MPKNDFNLKIKKLYVYIKLKLNKKKRKETKNMIVNKNIKKVEN